VIKLLLVSSFICLFDKLPQPGALVIGCFSWIFKLCLKSVMQS